MLEAAAGGGGAVPRCYDTKVANSEMAARLQSLAVVGPTVQVPPPPPPPPARPPARRAGPSPPHKHRHRPSGYRSSCALHLEHR